AAGDGARDLAPPPGGAPRGAGARARRSDLKYPAFFRGFARPVAEGVRVPGEPRFRACLFARRARKCLILEAGREPLVPARGARAPAVAPFAGRRMTGARLSLILRAGFATES